MTKYPEHLRNKFPYRLPRMSKRLKDKRLLKDWEAFWYDYYISLKRKRKEEESNAEKQT